MLETTIAIPLAVDGDRRPLRVTVGGALAMGWRVVKKHVLVLQFPEAYFASHDEITAFEERLIACMPRTCEVDGHDIGSGTVNFFVFTDAPLAAHTTFRKYLGTRAVERKLRVAYRSMKGERYTNLWPFRDARPFRLMYPAGEDPFSAASKRKIPKRSKPGVSKRETRPRE